MSVLMNLFGYFVGLLGRGIGLSQGLYVHNTDKVKLKPLTRINFLFLNTSSNDRL